MAGSLNSAELFLAVLIRLRMDEVQRHNPETRPTHVFDRAIHSETRFDLVQEAAKAPMGVAPDDDRNLSHRAAQNYQFSEENTGIAAALSRAAQFREILRRVEAAFLLD